MNGLRAIDRVLAPVAWLAAGLVVALLFLGPSLIGAEADPAQQAANRAARAGATPTATPAPTAEATATAEPIGPADTAEATAEPAEPAADGAAVFTANCGSCHTLQAAGTSGTTGPNLDEAAPDAARVSQIVRSGSGIMPSFEGQLSDAEIEAVAQFVSGGG